MSSKVKLPVRLLAKCGCTLLMVAETKAASATDKRARISRQHTLNMSVHQWRKVRVLRERASDRSSPMRASPKTAERCEMFFSTLSFGFVR